MSGATARVDNALRLTGTRTIVLGLFFFSGVSGLIYEIVWSRMFALVLGTTVYAIATVLGVFMGGLALGSWLFGRLADRPGMNGLRMYAWLELAIGAFALLLPLLMELSDVVYRAAWPAVNGSFAGQMLLRVVLAAMILVIPSTLMGGTLPILSRFLVKSRERTGREIGTLYAINTLGAVLGCFVAGFFLLEHLGIGLSLKLAAAFNFAVGGMALFWARGVDVPSVEEALPEEAPTHVRRYGPGQVRLALLLYAFSGFAALALEVLWTRSLLYFTSVDTWAFTSMLSAFLCGIGVGSLVMARFVGRIRNPLLLLGLIQVLIGLSAAASIPLFERLYGASMFVVARLPDQATLLAKIVIKLFCSFFIMLVPTLLMGAAFPLVSAIYVGARRQVGRGIGTLYALNTIGAIGGSVAAGFLMIPAFGLQSSVLFCASLYVVLGVALLAAATSTDRQRALVLAGTASVLMAMAVVDICLDGLPDIVRGVLRKVLVPGGQGGLLENATALLSAALFVALGLVAFVVLFALCAAAFRTGWARGVAVACVAPGLGGIAALNLGFRGTPIILETAFFKKTDQEHRLLWYREGAAASLVVLQNPVGTRLLNINGVTTAINNHMDMQVHRMLSHLPMLLHPDPQTVLIVGFGMGSTPWGCCQHDVERVDVVELLRSETQTAPLFEDVNHGVLDHPKLRFIEGDGRNYVLATRAAYDVISFNAIHPRYSAYLYTEDFYRLCRQRMAPDGVICAWMTQNSMKESEFRMLCRGFVEVFPNASLWYCNPEHFCLIGTMQPTKIDFDGWRTRMAVEGVRSDLKNSNLDDPFVLVSRYLFGAQSLARYVAGVPLNTDDKPRIEFTRSSKLEERTIIERLISLRETAAPLLRTAADAGAIRKRLSAYEQASKWLMIGQTEFWYPRPGGLLKPEIAYRRALLHCPENQDVRQNLVFSEKVKRETWQTLRAQPNHAGARARLGVILMEEGRFEQAQAHLIQALRIDPSLTTAGTKLGFISLFRGDPERAALWFEDVMRLAGREDPELLYGLAIALQRQGREREAVTYQERALAENPDVAEWFSLLERTTRAVRECDRELAGERG